MINFIIYEDNVDMQNTYKEVIKEFFHKKSETIRLYVFDRYRHDLEDKLNELEGSKIYILDIEVPGKSGLDLARTIRSSGDWLSPFIVVTAYEHLKNTGFTSKVLMLDFISKKRNIKNQLNQSLMIAYNIVCSNKSFTFQYDGELYHVPYEEILYFEKDLNDNYTFLITRDNLFKIKNSIINIERKLDGNHNFMRIHRSCIVNLDAIDKLDVPSNTIYFGNKQTCLLAREKKNALIHRLDSDKVIS